MMCPLADPLPWSTEASPNQLCTGLSYGPRGAARLYGKETAIQWHLSVPVWYQAPSSPFLCS